MREQWTVNQWSMASFGVERKRRCSFNKIHGRFNEIREGGETGLIPAVTAGENSQRPGLTVEHFYIKFGDPSCIGF